MKIYNGVDLVEVKEFRKYKRSSKFLAGVFTKREINYCFSKEYPEEYLASRFAAKEAVVKALGNMGKMAMIRDIEVVKNKNGTVSPRISKFKKIKNSSLSISHTKTFAIALFSIIE